MVQGLSSRVTRLYRSVFLDLWASLFRAKMPPLTAGSCSFVDGLLPPGGHGLSSVGLWSLDGGFSGLGDF
jgi:hypothetical protein